jgi:hypothetical protein
LHGTLAKLLSLRSQPRDAVGSVIWHHVLQVARSAMLQTLLDSVELFAVAAGYRI